MLLPPAPRLTEIQRLVGGIRFQFEAQAAVSYSVEHSGEVSSGTWLNLTNVAPDTIPRNVIVADVPGEIRRFYRVVAH